MHPALPGATAESELFAGVDEFKGRRRDWRTPTEISRRRYRLIGRLRRLLASAAVAALEPDIVILDEFQRFKDLLTRTTRATRRRAGAASSSTTRTRRLLLLSATPYKMYTLPDEPEGDDHYARLPPTPCGSCRTTRRGAPDVESSLAELRVGHVRGRLSTGRVDAKERVERRAAPGHGPHRAAGVHARPRRDDR